MSQAFDSYGDLRIATVQVVKMARLRLDIFDATGRDLALGQIDLVDAVTAFLHEPDARLRIAVHETGYLERDCARLLQLLRFHGHQIAIHRTLPEARSAQDTLIIADATNLLRRYHIDYARGQLEIATSEQISPWIRRFEAIWEASEEAVAFTTLGL